MAETELKVTLDSLTREGELYEKLDAGKVRCYACGHRCLIFDGKRGICQVRYNHGGKLYVPHGYVGALQVDPTEKKPFFHVLPGSQALTFGMLGCDFHCPYCFPGDTPVVTERGVLPIEEIFCLGKERLTLLDGEVSHPRIRVVTGSGKLRPVHAAFEHHYEGELVIIQPYYLPKLRCTLDHRLYATQDPTGEQIEILKAEELTPQHYLVVPKRYAFSNPVEIDVRALMQDEAVPRRYREVSDYYLIPIRSITKKHYRGPVYNLEVDDPAHNYLAEFFLVKNCQNWQISQTLRDNRAGSQPMEISSQQLVELADRYRAEVVASSYNEPLITAEWAHEIFSLAKERGFRTAYVSNGNATPEVLKYLRPVLDCYKVDLKTMSDRNYRKLGGVLKHILNTIGWVYEMGFWLEIVTLVIPGFNDSDEELREAAEFLVDISPDIPWHVTAFHKDYQMTDPDNTPAETLIRAAEIGYDVGLHYVYAGNLPGIVGRYENTYCPNCNELLIERFSFQIHRNRLEDGGCPACGAEISGIWTNS
ncbi:MAG: radical SAM protein [Candidatus Bipolaricaulia bacterium]